MSIQVDSDQRDNDPSLDQVREMIKQGVTEISDADYRSVAMPCQPFDKPAAAPVDEPAVPAVH
ncbi:MAG: hypothetical protein V7742_08580 [Halioglobus sp.]